MSDAVVTCPTCKRWLVRYHDDGSFDLAAHAEVTVAGVSLRTPDRIAVGPKFPSNPSLGKATCYRRRCRFRRWLHGR